MYNDPMRDLVTSHLREDARIQASVLAIRRIYNSSKLEIFLCVYSGLIGNKTLHEDLITVLVHFRGSALRVMAKLWVEEIRGDRNQYLEEALRRLVAEGHTPQSLADQVANWAGLKKLN